MISVVANGFIVELQELRKTKTKEIPVINFRAGFKEGKEIVYMDVVCYDRTAENVDQYLKKGSRFALRGSVAQKSWEDNEKKKHYSTYMVADKIEFLGSQSSPKDESSENAAPTAPAAPAKNDKKPAGKK